MHEMLTILTDVRGVCLSVCLSRGLNRGGACSVRRVPRARGHLVQPLSNVFGLLLNMASSTASRRLSRKALSTANTVTVDRTASL